ncbi:MAG: hypothetical protein VYA34_08110 [Myxococcota bacterium]|nr:hypothetical protein [Myxococcota bacterium]
MQTIDENSDSPRKNTSNEQLETIERQQAEPHNIHELLHRTYPQPHEFSDNQSFTPQVSNSESNEGEPETIRVIGNQLEAWKKSVPLQIHAELKRVLNQMIVPQRILNKGLEEVAFSTQSRELVERLKDQGLALPLAVFLEKHMEVLLIIEYMGRLRGFQGSPRRPSFWDGALYVAMEKSKLCHGLARETKWKFSSQDPAPNTPKEGITIVGCSGDVTMIDLVAVAGMTSSQALLQGNTTRMLYQLTRSVLSTTQRNMTQA